MEFDTIEVCTDRRPPARAAARVKVVTVCHRGNVRSVGLAWELKETYPGYDPVAIGYGTAGPELSDLLYRWADVIVVMMAGYERHVPAEFKDKTRLCDVGADTYGNPQHPRLKAKIKAWVDGGGLK